MPNVELMERVLEHIEADPAHWDQQVWATVDTICGTSHCFAGWTVGLAGHDIQFEPGSCSWPACTDVHAKFTIDGAAPYWDEVAEADLGIVDSQLTITLFAASRSLDDLRQIVRLAKEGLTADEIDEAFWNIRTGADA